MGILDQHKDPRINTRDEIRRQKVLRANIERYAEKHGLTYRKAVEDFAAKIGRSHNTVFMWMSEARDGKGSPRPMPIKHYDVLIEAGMIDESLDGRPSSRRGK